MSDGFRPTQRHGLVAAAPRLASLLLKLEADAYADARPCPFCHAPLSDAGSEGLAHAADCELDEVLRAAGLRLV